MIPRSTTNKADTAGFVFSAVTLGMLQILALEIAMASDLQELIPFPNTTRSVVNQISADGSVAVGWAWVSSETNTRGFVRAGGEYYSLSLSGDAHSSGFMPHANGQVVTGQSCPSTSPFCQATVWSPARGVELLTLPGDQQSGYGAVAENGSTVLGYSIAPDRTIRSVIWTYGSGLSALPNPTSYNRIIGNAVSADGLTVAGEVGSSGAPGGAFMWTATHGISLLGALPGNVHASASYVSPDSSMISGDSCYQISSPYQGRCKAFVWTQATGMQPLLLPGDIRSGRSAVSADGSTIIGSSCNEDDSCRAFGWTLEDGVFELGILPGRSSSSATAVSRDGSTIGGAAYTEGVIASNEAWVWSKATGTVGLGVLPGDDASRVDRVSADGTFAIALSCDAAMSECMSFVWGFTFGAHVLAAPGDDVSYVVGLPDNGALLAGESCNAIYTECHAFTWSPQFGVQLLSLPNYSISSGGHISSDGSIVLATACNVDWLDCVPFIWTPATGATELEILPTDMWGWGSGISVDGSTAFGESCPDASGMTCKAVIWKISSGNEVATPSGSDVAVDLVVNLPDGSSSGNVQLTFDVVDVGGTTTITASSTPIEGESGTPSGFVVGTPPLYYDVDTTASFSGSVTLCFGWQEDQFENEGGIRLFHYEDSAWTDVTVSIDTQANQVCGQVTSLSPFALFEFSYSFTGFFPPVDNPPVSNVAKSGSAIPVKFSLGGNRGLAIFKPGYPASQAVNCDSGDPQDIVTETATPGSSELSYDGPSDRYNYVWKTQKSWANSCRRLTLKFADGSQYSADFGFRK